MLSGRSSRCLTIADPELGEGIRPPFYSLHHGLCLLQSTGPRTCFCAACRENNPIYISGERKKMHMYLLVPHTGSVMAKSKSYKWQGQTCVLPLLTASSFCRASVVLGQTGVKADMKVIQVLALVRRALSSPASAAPR